jgi:hypothetical protein
MQARHCLGGQACPKDSNPPLLSLRLKSHPYLDGLTPAEYSIDDTSEAFTIVEYPLGNKPAFGGAERFMQQEFGKFTEWK